MYQYNKFFFSSIGGFHFTNGAEGSMQDMQPTKMNLVASEKSTEGTLGTFCQDLKSNEPMMFTMGNIYNII